MLQTLAKIGEQLLEGKGIWASLTTEPKYDPEKKNWVCPILFDCVNKEIRVLRGEIKNQIGIGTGFFFILNEYTQNTYYMF